MQSPNRRVVAARLLDDGSMVILHMNQYEAVNWDRFVTDPVAGCPENPDVR